MKYEITEKKEFIRMEHEKDFEVVLEELGDLEEFLDINHVNITFYGREFSYEDITDLRYALDNIITFCGLIKHNSSTKDE